MGVRELKQRIADRRAAEIFDEVLGAMAKRASTQVLRDAVSWTFAIEQPVVLKIYDLNGNWISYKGKDSKNGLFLQLANPGQISTSGHWKVITPIRGHFLSVLSSPGSWKGAMHKTSRVDVFGGRVRRIS